ncbi:MAG: nucleotide-binding protein [Solirubrobacteraceae bacterium]
MGSRRTAPQPTSTTVTEEEVEEVEEGGSGGTGRRRPRSGRACCCAFRAHEEEASNRIFIGHGKNHAPLDQLTKTLDNLGIPYAVAEGEPNMGRPISQKVHTMACGAAILIFSADEHFDADQNPVWKNSENVSHELGVAAVMYDNRVILFKEDSVQLALQFQRHRLHHVREGQARRQGQRPSAWFSFGLKILRVAMGDDDED